MAAPLPIDFNAVIRPILNKNCMACHGGVKKAGGISFLFREEAMVAGESGKPAITPGDPSASHLLDRIADTKDPMPPADHGVMLTAGEVASIRQWIAEGANWADHWAFIAPRPQTVPSPADLRQDTSAIDAFILERLAGQGLEPNPAADPATLLRRVSFDLIGLPPAIADLDAFAANPTHAAYTAYVDRLLASPAFGERWAAVWLDLARYADTQGYEKDPHREIWPYRDWVINALNANLPYDQFLIQQLAGDLLPDATIPQLAATGFHRNTQTNTEGGTDDEEFRTAAVLDRVATTWSAFSGITFHCVQCHSHPYDPIRHEEFFSFLAFFNNSADADLNDDFPVARIPADPARYPEASALHHEERALRHTALTADHSGDIRNPAKWEALAPANASAVPTTAFELAPTRVTATGTVAGNATYTITWNPPGTSSNPVTAFRLTVPPARPDTAVHSPEHGFVINGIALTAGSSSPLPIARVLTDTSDEPDDPQGIAAGKGAFTALPSLHRARHLVLIPATPVALPLGQSITLSITHRTAIAEKPAPARRIELSSSEDPLWTKLAGDPVVAAASLRLDAVRKALAAIPGTTMPVMRERAPDNQRQSRVFVRGNWLDKGDKPVPPGVPKSFPPLPPVADGQIPNRLTLARWLTSSDHPLTSRVAVNRFWEQLFGVGIVETLEDFGAVGEPPSHPALLDFLALRFQRDLHWDTKAMLREMVLSASYRQSSRSTTAQSSADPRNRLLARGPRLRLSAEMVRDQALSASGLLNRTVGGKSVMPPQPDGVWNTVYSGAQWQPASGPQRYRRALYTYGKRTSPYPSFQSFDAPSRDVCSVRRIPTNTPLQALVTLNDPVYVEAAAALAKRAIAESSADPAQWLARAHRLVTSQQPATATLQRLIKLQASAQASYQSDPALLAASSHATANAAANAVAAAAILNLDAAFTR